MINIRGTVSSVEAERAVAILDSLLGHTYGWESTRERCLESHHIAPELFIIAIDGDKVVGAISSDGFGVINAMGVLEAYRCQKIGQKLLKRAEDVLRIRGVKEVSFGSLHEAVGFYLKLDYKPQLLVQNTSGVENDEAWVKQLLSGVLAGREVSQTRWQGHAQLWLQEPRVDWELKDRIEAVTVGVVGQCIMTKRL